MPVPDIPDVLEEIARGNAADVIPTIEYLADLMPRSATAYALLGRAYESEQLWEEALVAWQRCLFSAPNSRAALSGIQRAIKALSKPSSQTTLTTPSMQSGGAGPVPAVLTPERSEPAAPGDDAADAWERTVDLSREKTDFASTREQFEGDETPQETGQGIPTTAREIDDLDRLIEELESARIVPNPDFAAAPPPEFDEEIDDVVSETLARIYAAQQQFDEAARVYELLAAQQPGRRTEFLKKATDMRSRAG